VIGDRLRFATRWTDDEHLLLVTAVSEKRDPFPVRRPPRAAAVPLVRAGELEGLLSVARDPELVVEAVPLPFGRADAEHDAPPVGGDCRSTSGAERDHLLE
jgi:hypothetical protein